MSEWQQCLWGPCRQVVEVSEDEAPFCGDRHRGLWRQEKAMIRDAKREAWREAKRNAKKL